MYKVGHRQSKEVREKIRQSKIRDKNHQWIKENPSYGSVHLWLIRNFKKSKHCDLCSSSRFLEFALKKGKKHDHNRDNYLCLCSSCHKKYDYTLEHRQKTSQALKGRKITWADKISKANKGRIPSQKTILAVIKANKTNPRPRGDGGRFKKI